MVSNVNRQFYCDLISYNDKHEFFVISQGTKTKYKVMQRLFLPKDGSSYYLYCSQYSNDSRGPYFLCVPALSFENALYNSYHFPTTKSVSSLEITDVTEIERMMEKGIMSFNQFGICENMQEIESEYKIAELNVEQNDNTIKTYYFSLLRI